MTIYILCNLLYYSSSYTIKQVLYFKLSCDTTVGQDRLDFEEEIY